MPCEPMYCQAPAVMPANIESPASISSCSRGVAQRPTRLPFAITAIGERRCVRKSPIGLPDWTTSVCSSSIVLSASTMRSKLSQSRAALAEPA